MDISLAHSPDADDIFMYYAIYSLVGLIQKIITFSNIAVRYRDSK